MALKNEFNRVTSVFMMFETLIMALISLCNKSDKFSFSFLLLESLKEKKMFKEQV